LNANGFDFSLFALMLQEFTSLYILSPLSQLQMHEHYWLTLNTCTKKLNVPSFLKWLVTGFSQELLTY
jgi:hypothetical protein